MPYSFAKMKARDHARRNMNPQALYHSGVCGHITLFRIPEHVVRSPTSSDPNGYNHVERFALPMAELST